MGLTFKENCADIRNSGINGYRQFKEKNCNVDLFDPWVDKKEVKQKYNMISKDILKNNYYDGVILAVKHKIFMEMGYKKILNLCKETCYL